MIFRSSKLVKDLRKLDTLLQLNEKITYMNLWSLKVNGSFDHKLYFILDGLCVHKYAKLFGINADLISFNKSRKFWICKFKSYKRILLIGHTQVDLINIEKKMLKVGYSNVKALCEGFTSDEEILFSINSYMKNGDIVILALGQPRSEIIMGKLSDDLPGPIVAVGAFLKQLYLEDNVVPPYIQYLGLAAIYRHHGNPKKLFERTLGSLRNLTNFYLKEDK